MPFPAPSSKSIPMHTKPPAKASHQYMLLQSDRPVPMVIEMFIALKHACCHLASSSCQLTIQTTEVHHFRTVDYDSNTAFGHKNIGDFREKLLGMNFRSQHQCPVLPIFWDLLPSASLYCSDYRLFELFDLGASALTHPRAAATATSQNPGRL